MSEHSGEQLSRGSSQSIFSGLGTSSVSGGSESGHINVEDLSNHQLENVVEDIKGSLKILILETLMFESYFERLMSGQVSLTPTDSGGLAPPSRKGSGTMTSDSTSETDSQPPTAGTSLLDVSNRSHSTRKRSSSRASLGSRGKSLRLSLEQKNGIASREMDRIEHELMEFRVRSRKETREGMAEINERVLKLEEVEKSRNLLVKGIAQAKLPVKEIGNSKSKDAPPVKYDYEKLADFFRTEIAAEKRMFLKLETRNGVTSSQISRVLSQVRTVQSASEESGPVNLEQLRLENENHCSLLHSQNLEVIALRKAMVGTRRRKNYYMEKLTVEAARRERLKKDLMNLAKVKEAVSKSIASLQERLTHQRRKNRRLSDLEENYEAPSFNEYMDLKWQEIRLKQREKVEERKRNLEKLEQSVRRQRAKSADSRRLKQTRKRREALNGGGEGKLIRGMTFNIEFKTVPRVS